MASVYSFTGDFMRMYMKLAESHSHPQGPWAAMLSRVQGMSLPEGARILDLASGHGEPARTVATALPRVNVVSTDFSADMVGAATQRCAGLANVTCSQADIQALPFEDDSFDVILCCYGLMFPADKTRSFSEVFRVLKPGGTLIATYWQHLPFLAFSARIATVVRDGVAPPPNPQGPLSLKEPGAFDALASAAGFTLGERAEGVYPFLAGASDDESFQIAFFPISAMAAVDPAPHHKSRAAFDSVKGEFLVAATESDGYPAAPVGTMLVHGNNFVLQVATKP
jgi:SAM-dependent methyltransferase